MIKDENTKIVYLWSYNYQYCVAKIEGLAYDEVVIAVGTDYINNLSAKGNPTKDEIEQIRTKINSSGKMALITTYSYIPMVGMITATDPHGVSTTYNYDDFGRLISSRDDDNHLLSQIKYNYSHLNYNTEQSGIFTRNNCGAGYVGSQVTYTVPANKYSSTISVDDANLKAQSEISTNGQNYANANGTCSSPCTGNENKLINGNCETGIKVYTKSVLWGSDPTTYNCTYHYEWSDGSRSPVNYSEISYDDCLSF